MTACWCSVRAGRSCATSRRSCPRSARRPSCRRPSPTSPPRRRCESRSRWRSVGSRGTPGWASSFVGPRMAAGGLLTEDVSLHVRFARATLGRERINDLVASIVARPGPYKSGRLALRARLVSEARPRSARRDGSVPTRPGSRASYLVGGIRSAAGHAVAHGLPHHPGARPALVPRAAGARCAPACSPATSGSALLRSRGHHGLVHGVEHRRPRPARRGRLPIGGGRRSYGHIVVDEAQDLTPMQFRMIARRSPSGSITVLGDLAQATGPWTYESWDEIRAHLPDAARARTTMS